MKYLNQAILLAAAVLGLGSLLMPFVNPPDVSAPIGPTAHAGDAPALFVALLILCLAAVASSLSGGQMNSKSMAVLGVLTAMNAVLRAIPGPGGFSAIFLLPIICGYVYGSTFGFLLGSLSLLVSALIGGGIGPWLPYQMLSAGWVGMVSGWLPRARSRRAEVLLLVGWGLISGLLFGAIMNLWFWPFISMPGGSDIYWTAGDGVLTGLRRYLAFYVITSLWWDALRAGGNALLLGLFGPAFITTLRRYQRRFHFTLG